MFVIDPRTLAKHYYKLTLSTSLTQTYTSEKLTLQIATFLANPSL